MTPAPDPTRASRSRRQVVLSRAALRIGFAACILLGFIILFTVAIRRLDRSPPVQPEYAEAARRGDSASAHAQGQPTEIAPVPAHGIPDIEAKRPQLLALASAFFQSANVEERSLHVRQRERVLPLMMSFYHRQPLRIREVTGLGNCMSVAEKGQRLGYIEVLFKQGPSAHVIMEEQSEGGFLVDWESLTRYSEMSWDDFLRSKPQKPVLMRVLATKEIGQAKSKNRTWLQLASPGHSKTAKASFDSSAPEMAPLLAQLDLGGWKNVPLTLRVCYSENNSAPGIIQVVGIEGKGWLILN